MPAGRPTLYSDEMCERVVDVCGDGYSLTGFAGKIGVARSTINEWMEKHPEFSEAVNRAKALRTFWWEDRGRNVAKDGGSGGQATMVIFGLKNHAPEDYSDKSTTQLVGPGGGPIELAVLTPEQRQAKVKGMIEDAFAPPLALPAPKGWAGSEIYDAADEALSKPEGEE